MNATKTLPALSLSHGVGRFWIRDAAGELVAQGGTSSFGRDFEAMTLAGHVVYGASEAEILQKVAAKLAPFVAEEI